VNVTKKWLSLILTILRCPVFILLHHPHLYFCQEATLSELEEFFYPVDMSGILKQTVYWKFHPLHILQALHPCPLKV
jgi:hypothetical protein